MRLAEVAQPPGEKADDARRVATLWMSFCLSGAVAVGFFGAAFFAEHRDVASLVEQNHERVFIVLLGLLFNPWIAGILMSAILAAVMSTLSCQLLVCSSTLTEDFYRTFIRRNASQRELVWFGRSMVLLVSVVAVWLARDPNSLVLSLVSYAWAGFGAAFGPVIIMSLWWRRMTRNGALAGMITGAVTVLVWNHYAWLGLYEILPGFVFALIAIVVVSLLDKAPSKSIAKTFDEVQAAVRNPADRFRPATIEKRSLALLFTSDPNAVRASQIRQNLLHNAFRGSRRSGRPHPAFRGAHNRLPHDLHSWHALHILRPSAANSASSSIA